MNGYVPEAASPEGVSIRGDGYTTEAGWFGPQDRPRFGWLYRPDKPAPNGVGVVIVPPFGREDICAHRTLRHLAEAAARAGFLALRFDLDGSGDSAGDDADPDRIGAWIRSIGDGCDLVCSRGASQLMVVGVRLGATLAIQAAQARSDVSALVAFNAVVSGKAYLRELRALQMAMDLVPLPGPSDEGGQETNGFLLNAEACERLKGFDLAATAAPASRLWWLERDDLAERHTGWFDTWKSAGCQIVQRRIPGYTKMMDAPHANRVAQEFIDACIECATSMPVRSNAGPAGGQRELRSSIALRVGENTIREQVVNAGDCMFGILAEPSKPTSGPALLILNAGAIRHIGSNRMSVPLARELAADGWCVLRADLPGIGDSPAYPGEDENIVYGPHGAQDVAKLVDWLHARGARNITVGGMCSGAYHAFRGALIARQVSRIYMINCGVFGATVDFDPDGPNFFGDVAHYSQSVKSTRAWRRLLAGKVAIGSVIHVAAWHLEQRTLRVLRNAARCLRVPLHDDLGYQLLALGRRGTFLHFLYSRGDPGRTLLANEAGSSLRRLRRRGRCDMQLFEGADHTFTQRWAQSALHAALLKSLRWNPHEH